MDRYFDQPDADDEPEERDDEGRDRDDDYFDDEASDYVYEGPNCGGMR